MSSLSNCGGLSGQISVIFSGGAVGDEITIQTPGARLTGSNDRGVLVKAIEHSSCTLSLCCVYRAVRQLGGLDKLCWAVSNTQNCPFSALQVSNCLSVRGMALVSSQVIPRYFLSMILRCDISIWEW